MASNISPRLYQGEFDRLWRPIEKTMTILNASNETIESQQAIAVAFFEAGIRAEKQEHDDIWPGA